MDFARQALYDFLEAMATEKFEKDYPLQGLTIDAFFVRSKIGVCYNGAGVDVVAKATKNRKIARYLKENGIVLVPFEIGDVCKDAVLKKIPQVCNKHKIAENSYALHLATARLIKGVMAEIRQEPEINEWSIRPPDYNPAEEPQEEPQEELPEGLPEEILENLQENLILEVETDNDKISEGELEHVNNLSNPSIRQANQEEEDS